jgi:hypothetical protein
MNKTLSVFDLMLAEPLQGFTMFDCVDLANLDAVNNVLAVLGFDTNKPIFVEAHNHRTLAGQVKIGYVFKGHIAHGREHVHGKYSTPHDMYAAAEATGQDWYDELLSMGTRSVSYGSDALDDKIPSREEPEYRAEEQKILDDIKLLNDLLVLARGDQRRSDGSIKTAYDYKTPEAPPEKAKRRKKGFRNEVGYTEDE